MIVKLLYFKTRGCYRQFGVRETLRRVLHELLRSARHGEDGFDISLVSQKLAIGAAPRSLKGLRELRNMRITHIIDLRAERKESDILAKVQEVKVSWIPTYDDWQPKSCKYFEKLSAEIRGSSVLGDSGRLLICCGAGKHRAPLAGVLALMVMGHSLENASSMIKKMRPVAELLPVYMSSLRSYLDSRMAESA